MVDNTSDSGMGFGFSGIKNFLDTVTVAANQKAASAKKTAEVVQFEASQVADSQMEYADSADKALVRLKEVEAQGTKARAMADSGNIFDRISLIGDQILTPQEYTREGRMGRTAEIGSNLALEGQIQSIKISASQARVQERQADETVETMDSSAGLAKLQMQVDAMGMAAQAIQTTETLRATNLSKIDLPTLDKAMVGPVPANGKVTIDGFQYSPLEIRERQKDLDTRTKLSFLSPSVTDPDLAAKMKVHQGLTLQTMSLPDLEALRSNNYMLPDGSQVFGDVWDHEYDRKRQMQAITLDRKYNDTVVMNQLPVMMQDATTMLKSGQKYYVPGTPAGSARNKFQAELQSIATDMKSDPTPEAAVIQTKRIQSAQDRYIQEVTLESKRLAGGDTALTAIYTNQRLGLPMSSDDVSSFVVSRYKEGKDFGTGVLPDGMSRKFKGYADEALIGVKRAQAQDILGVEGKLTDKDMRERAAQQAYERLQMDSGVEGMNVIQQAIRQRTDSPAAKAGLVPGQLQDIGDRAFKLASDEVAQTENITEAQMEAIRAGRFEDTGFAIDRGQAIAEQINTKSMFYEYDLLDKTRPGLGYEMQQWYGSILPEMARSYTAGLDPTEQAATGDSVLTEAQKFHQLMTYADESATDRGKQTAIEMSVGAKKPENMWPVILQLDKTLADSQKQTIFYDVIVPAMKQARAKNADDPLTTQAVFDALARYKSEDKTTMAAINGFTRNMPALMDSFSNVWDIQLARTSLTSRRPGQTNLPQLDLNASIKKLVPWMRDETAAPAKQGPIQQTGIAPAGEPPVKRGNAVVLPDFMRQ